MMRSYILTFFALVSTLLVTSSKSHSNPISKSQPSDFVLQQTKKWLSRTPPFQNCSSDEEISNSIVDLLAWKTPDYFVKHFPYYLSGLSYEKLPVYISECGKYDIVALLRQGPELMENVDKAIAQVIVRGFESMENGGLDGTNYKISVILDFDGLKYSQYSSVAALELMMRVALQYRVMADHFAQNVYLINGNYALDSLYKMFRPMFGRLNERIEVYGSKKPKWKAALRREFPLDVLPPWYGGYGNFTPMAAYG